MKKIRSILVILQIALIVFSILPLKITQSYQVDENDRDINSFANQANVLVETPTYYPNSALYNQVEDSFIEKEFNITDSADESQDSFSIDNCDDWSLKNRFEFTDIRGEKIINGDAETTDTIWTDYIPSHYEGNVTRENTPPHGNVISGDYSWYFDLKTDDNMTIVGFDNPINVSSNSVIFSFSYSLLRNNLGTTYDSNICIRLFFQFDIYIFIWFNGNIGVLSNVTGPGGYADLLVNQASFDGVTHEYSLNVTDLGLDLFNQEPDQLRSLAIQTWGELPYQMEFLLDDISLTDAVSPSDISLVVNSHPVIGNIGEGLIVFSENPTTSINYNIDYSYFEKVLWNYNYELIGTGRFISKRTCEFNSWSQILWTESFNETYQIPSLVTTFDLYKWLSIDWVFDEVLLDDISIVFEIDQINITHQKIRFNITNFNSLQLHYFSENYMENLLLSSYSVTHSDSLTVSIESSIYNKEIFLYILDSNEQVLFSDGNITNSGGNALFSNIQLESETPRGSYTVIAYWYLYEHVGIARKTFDLTTFPTKAEPTNYYITVNYRQNFIIEIDFINLEINTSIDLATVEYTGDFGSAYMQQNIDNKYYATVNNNINPGLFTIEVICSKTDFATAYCILEIEIVFSDFSLTLNGPSEAIPGGTVSALAQVTDNESNPIQDMELRFRVNDIPFLDTWTNNSGYATMLYYLTPIYSYNTLNISCSVIVDEVEFLTETKLISIDLFDLPRAAEVGAPYHTNYIETNDTTSFSFQITYTSIGLNWYANTPVNFDPISAIVTTNSANLTAVISPVGVITWVREITNTTAGYDLLTLEIMKPQPNCQIDIDKNSISIEISIITNTIPYDGIEIKLNRESDWLKFNQWNLYLNGDIVTEECELEINDNYISFKISSSDQISILTYNLEGIKSSLIQISPSTIILGLGLLVLTIISSILLAKRKSNVSLDIQI